MVSSGDIRRHSGKQQRVRDAANSMLEAVEMPESTPPETSGAVEARDQLVQAVRDAMAATGVRQPA